MEIFRWVKPESISFFPAYACASIPINIGLNPPIFASDIPQELKIYLIMVLGKHVPIWHLQPQNSIKFSPSFLFSSKLIEQSWIKQEEKEVEWPSNSKKKKKKTTITITRTWKILGPLIILSSKTAQRSLRKYTVSFLLEETHIKGNHNSSSVIRRQLNGSTEKPMKVKVLRHKPRAWK